MSNDTGVSAEDALQLAQQAVGRINELEDTVEELRDDKERLTFRVAELESTLPDENTPYEELSFENKVGRVRSHLMKRARNSTNDWAKLEYSDVLWSVFDGDPSPDHCYKLMKHAAGETEDGEIEVSGDPTGFHFSDPDNGTRYVSVDMGEVKAQAPLSHANKATMEGDD